MFIRVIDLVSGCETLDKKIVVGVLCVIALVFSIADLVAVFVKVDCEAVKADSFQLKAHDNDNGFSISTYAVIPFWQESSVSGHDKEVNQ